MSEHAGELACVGLGIILGGQLTALARNQLAQADQVFLHGNSPLLLDFLLTINPKVVDLQPLYRAGESRRDSYEAMIALVVQAVTDGRRVCWACYGHPAVASWPPGEAVRRLQAAGYRATLHAGVSADACLYADLNIDPLAHGCLQFEASQFLFYRRQVDVTAYLILWQLNITGDYTLQRLDSDRNSLDMLVASLCRWYPPEHQVILYEASELAIWPYRADHLPLATVPEAELSQATTLVIPPLHRNPADTAVLDALAVPAGHYLRRQ
ncbi:SAM-dependent methyltransferase [Kineobactrum salinum]|uniref:Tetrapyrrole methylase domain-containing protein n=1 Tax=Kineobactrum salinum TaxID=2708301 RepID=A0A6C0U1I5_9GAMM|nr:SAM-dependent methyltransferase [Kineobactrum salinum]QIB65653.1 hypothetical protein G3T16_09760 [Kineobactrum salinum]